MRPHILCTLVSPLHQGRGVTVSPSPSAPCSAAPHCPQFCPWVLWGSRKTVGCDLSPCGAEPSPGLRGEGKISPCKEKMTEGPLVLHVAEEPAAHGCSAWEGMPQSGPACGPHGSAFTPALLAPISLLLPAVTPQPLALSISLFFSSPFASRF